MLTKEIIHMGYGDDPINGKKVIAQAKQEIENGNLFISNTYEEYCLIQKIKGKYIMGTYSIVSHDGQDVELTKAVVDSLFDEMFTGEGSSDYFYMKTNGNNTMMKFRHDIVDSILDTKEQHAPKARQELHFVN